MAKGNYKNITVDADLVEKLNDVCNVLEVRLGFRPTLSQALRHCISAFNKANGDNNAN